ncbi:MAG: antibiotic biosynthesis monooxygenase [Pseudomonadota bacterium]
MIAVIFEVEPADGAMEGYMALAASLKAEVEAIDGFISVERFESMTTPGKLVSLSFWRDEAALDAWRNRPRHRKAQVTGRTGMMAGYRLRVASVIRDYGMEDRAEAPSDAVPLGA